MASATDSVIDFVKDSVTVPLAALNSHIQCLVCKGYLRDACKLAECLHTVCRVCIRATEMDCRPPPQGRQHKCPVSFCQHAGQQRVLRDTALQTIVDKIALAAERDERAQ